jgi:hypothetical protein
LLTRYVVLEAFDVQLAVYFSNIFRQFLLEIGVVKDPADVGFYSGIVESIYAVSSLLAGKGALLSPSPKND